MGFWAAASVARWPKFQPKSSQEAGEKKSLPEEFLAENKLNFFQNKLNFFQN
jgi:hypothetical protein